MNNKEYTLLINKVILAFILYRTGHRSVLIEIGLNKILFKYDGEKTIENYIHSLSNAHGHYSNQNTLYISNSSTSKDNICFEFNDNSIFLSKNDLSIKEIQDLKDKFCYVATNFDIHKKLDKTILSDMSADKIFKKNITFFNGKIPFLPLQIYNKLSADKEYTALVDSTNKNYSNKDLLELVNKAYVFLEKSNLENNSVIVLHGKLDIMMIASSIAIWIKGFTLVLLDSQLNNERKNQILSSVKPSLIISTSYKGFNYNEVTFKTIELLDSSVFPALKEPDNWHKVSAYITFTSGSTGKPKGILASHAGFSHFINWQVQEFNINKSDKCGQFTALTFDVIYRSIYAPLLGGATLFLSPYDVSQPVEIASWLSSNKISMFNIVPTILNFWLDTTDIKKLHHLRYIFSAGEKLTNSLLKKLKFKWNYDSYIINFYGPSETTLAKFYKKILNTQNFTQEIIDVGHPIPDTHVFIFNGSVKCAVNEIGEILIRTPFRSLGYLNSDNNSFKALDFDGSTDIYYFTGDLGKITLDGNLLILDRVDNQIKINGIRIELGEIECIASQSSSVKENAVIYYDNQIILFLVPNTDYEKEKLEKFLESKLPQYMLPQCILIKNNLPKNKNGKLDRKQLLVEYKSNLNNNTSSHNLNAKELTVQEIKLITICQNDININIYDTGESFLKLGFDSLSLMRLIVEIQKQLSIKLTIQEVYQHNSIHKLANRLNEKEVESNSIKLEKSTDKQKFPATDAQKRVYFSTEVDPSGKAYNIISAFRIKGKFDTSKFENALNVVVNSNNILKSHFIFENDKLVLEASDHHKLNLLKNKISENQMQNQIQLLNQKFNLRQGPLYIFALFEINSNEFIFAYNIHHSIFDGQSHQIFLQQIWDFYFYDKTPIINYDYKDYAYHETKFINKDRDNLDYWLHQLKNVPILELPTEQPRSIEKNYNGDLISIKVSDELQSRLSDTALNAGITEFTLLMSAFSLLIRKYSMQEDFVIGVPGIGRYLTEFQDMIGMFVDTLPIRVHPQGDKSFIDFSNEIHSKILEALDHVYPFNSIINKLKIKQEGGRNPLIDVMFTFWEGATNFQLKNCANIESKSIRSIHNQTSKFDILCYLDVNDDGWFINFEYDVNLFSNKFIERMLNNFLVILENIPQCDTNTKIKEINSITDLEKNLILNKLSYTEFELISDISYVNLFNDQVNKTPDSLATVDNLRSLTYQELHLLSNIIAKKLSKLGGKSDFIPIYMERSVYMTASIIAILKSGMAYVPIDLDYPEERIMYILQDCGAKTIITTGNSLKQFKGIGNKFDLNIICVDELNIENKEFIYVDVKNEDPFVLFYTSGTTGNPKGVIQNHQALVNFANYENTLNEITEKDNVAFYSSFGFDVSMWSLLLPLLKGATNYIVPEEVRFSLYDLNIYFERNDITVALLPTQLCENFMMLIENKSLRLLWTAGEKLKKYTRRPYRLINGYGPTEYTGCTTRFEVIQSYENVPIGKPLGNTWVYLMSQYNELQPIGANGELCISGVQLSQGYLNLPEENNKKFICNPFAKNEINKKLYKTGDIARWQPNGNLIYLGRLDDQVKIRGYRIEITEIEACLTSVTEIKEAAVLAKTDQSETKYLVAFYTSKKSLLVNDIKEKLVRKIPKYMIPEKFIYLEKMPINTNGKINKKELDSIDINISAKIYTKPQTDTEKSLASIWYKILKSTTKISRDDDFFDLGGDSIKAIMMNAHIKRDLACTIPIKEIFRNSTLSEFSQIIDEQLKQGKDFLDLASHDKKNLYKEFPLTDVQQAYLVGRSDIFELGGVSTHVYREDTFEYLNIDKLNKALNKLIQRHHALRCIFSLEKGTQCFLKSVPIYEIKYQNLSGLNLFDQESGLKQWRTLMANQVFNVNTYPLFEYRVTHLSNSYILHFSFDALIMDAHSMRFFMQELTALYNNLEYELEPIEITFRDYILAFDRLKQSKRYETDKTYWQARIPELPLGPELKTRILPDQVKDNTFSRKTRQIPKEIWSVIKEKIKVNKISPTVPFLSLYGDVLAKYSINKHFLINLTLFNREPIHENIDSVLGDFTTLELFEYKREKSVIIDKFKATQDILWDDLTHVLYSGLSIQADLNRYYSLGMDSLIAPVVLTSLLGMKYHDDKFLSDCYKGRTYAITQTSQVWLDNKIYEKNEELIIEWDFVSELFDHDMIDKMINIYHNSIIQLFDKNWSKDIITLKSPQRDIAIMRAVNKTFNKNVLPNENETLHGAFIEMAKKLPNNLALIDGENQYTYQQILDQVISVSKALIHSGLKPQDKVVIYFKRNYKLVPSLLGIMASAGVYIPINIKWPLSRLDDIVEISGARFIITDRIGFETLGRNFKASKNIEILVFEDCIAESSIFLDFPRVDIHQLAYIIFTSGSTGKPKGVKISHYGAMNTIKDINQRFGVQQSDRTLALSNISFDLSVYDIFGALASGATVVIPPDDITDKPLELLNIITKHNVTIYNSVPAIMNILTHTAQLKNIKSQVRVVLLSGDFIPLNLPKNIKKVLPKAKIISLGGATEGSIWSILYQIDKVNKSWRSIPYGKAMYNQGMWVVDEELQHSPIGIHGEICITGAGVAKGYIGDDEKTKKHFVTDDSNMYIYRTGDLGVMHPDGNIEILGRIDNQVKINGFRVELDEIHSQINTVKSVKNSVVRIIEHSKTNKEIVAYIEPYIYDSSEFKLAKIGIRKDLKNNKVHKLLQNNNPSYLEQAFIRKSYRNFTHQELNFDLINQLISQKHKYSNAHQMNSDILIELSEVLNILKAYNNDYTIGLNKYRYPSAGGLYPIRTYVYIPKKYGESLSGHYYYHPEKHSLILLKECDTQQSNDLYFIFNYYKPAMEKYYFDRSKAYAELEVGYITHLLSKKIPIAKVNQKEVFNGFDEEEVNVATFKYQASNSGIREIKAPNKMIVLQKDKKQNLIDCYLLNNFQVKIHEKIIMTDFGQTAGNEFILSEASTVLLPCGYDYVEIGEWTQYITEYLLLSDIGSCLFGVFDIGEDLGRTFNQRNFSTSIVLGYVTEEQKNSLHIEQNKKDDSKEDTIISHINKHLNNTLPYYMKPKHIIKLKEIPLTINGKIDFRALPKIENLKNNNNYIEPKTEYEKQIYRVWKELLKIDKISINEDFFAIGGNSLQAIMLALKLSNFFQRKLPTNFVYANKTIAKQAKASLEFLTQPTIDYCDLNSSDSDNLLILCHPLPSGSESYYELAQKISKSTKVIGVNNYFINYFDKISAESNEIINFYYAVLKRIIKENSNYQIYLGGWSLGGNIVLYCYEKLKQEFDNLSSYVILFDTINTYGEKNTSKDQVIEYTKEDPIAEKFMAGGFSLEQFTKFMNRTTSFLNDIQIDKSVADLLLFKCLEKIEGLYSDDKFNCYANIVNKIKLIELDANHISILIEEKYIKFVSNKLIEFLDK
ncbi:amino acid adenylation domain-containing protein [Thiotrichales bacterium 19S3-7]|nr:amino acid adenylation domain-containing protein [Thiotrichales bacterium 19S3-7]MCF6802925.1 amino acid adenylation domain-containing protein [Thiotrichales bacterium 19S3-11]